MRAPTPPCPSSRPARPVRGRFGRFARAALVGGALAVSTAAIAQAQAQAPWSATPAPTPLPPAQVLVPSVPTIAIAAPSAEGVAEVVVSRSREVLEAALASMGYSFADPRSVAAAQQRLGGGPRPDPATLFRVALLAGGDRSLHLHLYVEGELYAGELLVASVDGTGPFRQTVRGGPGEFLGALDAAVRALVPAPAQFDAASALRYRQAAAASLAAPATARPFVPAAPPPPRDRGPRFGGTLALGVTAGSTGNGNFRHVPLALRLDIHVNDRVVFGLYGAYVNLDLGARRASNLLGLVQIEDRLRFAATGRVAFPLRAAIGYLPRNGPVLRFAAGLRVPIRNGFELGADLFAPTIYFLPSARRYAYDASLELTKRFGPSMR